MRFTIEVDQEDDGRWLAEIPELPGVLVYGQTRAEAIARVQALALRVLADHLEHGETVPVLGEVLLRWSHEPVAGDESQACLSSPVAYRLACQAACPWLPSCSGTP